MKRPRAWTGKLLQGPGARTTPKRGGTLSPFPVEIAGLHIGTTLCRNCNPKTRKREEKATLVAHGRTHSSLMPKINRLCFTCVYGGSRRYAYSAYLHLVRQSMLVLHRAIDYQLLYFFRICLWKIIKVRPTDIFDFDDCRSRPKLGN